MESKSLADGDVSRARFDGPAPMGFIGQISFAFFLP